MCAKLNTFLFGRLLYENKTLCVVCNEQLYNQNVYFVKYDNKLNNKIKKKQHYFPRQYNNNGRQADT